jgi:RimJ/RimL family protein N-acetyltransferase
MTPAPTLKTARLTLRGPAKSDLDPITAMVTGSERMVHVGGNGSANDAWRALLAGIGHWQWHGYGLFTLTDTLTGKVLGRVGILNHLGWPEPELAWHLFDGAEGKGYAYEAAVAVRHWAGETCGLGALISMISPENARSQALARRLGAAPERETTHDGEAAIIFRHLPHSNPLAQAQLAEVRL